VSTGALKSILLACICPRSLKIQMSLTGVADDINCEWTQAGGDDLKGFRQSPDSLGYWTMSAASRVVGVRSLALIGTGAAQVKACVKGLVAGAAWIRVEVVHVVSLVEPPVYWIVFKIGECVYNLTLCAMETLCDGACWVGLTIGNLIRQHGTRVVIKCCILSGCLVCMTIMFAGHIVVRIAQVGCHTLLDM
jgi:hypothetical protein